MYSWWISSALQGDLVLSGKQGWRIGKNGVALQLRFNEQLQGWPVFQMDWGQKKIIFSEEHKEPDEGGRASVIAWESDVVSDVALFSTSSSWGLSFESQTPTCCYYLCDCEPVISLPSSLRKADLMWQIQGPRWQISQEFAVISTTHFMVRLPSRLEKGDFYFALFSALCTCWDTNLHQSVTQKDSWLVRHMITLILLFFFYDRF